VGSRADDPLRELLNRRLEKLASQATDAAGGPSADEIETITRLARLIELRDSLRPKRRNWWPALVLAGTLAAVSILLFVRIRETEIELEVASTELTFALAKEQVITGVLDLAALGVSGLRSVELPVAAGGVPAGAPAVSLTRESAGGREGSVTLAPVLLPAGARVTLRYSDVPNQVGVFLNAAGLALQGTLNGPIRAGLAGAPVREFNFASPKPIALAGGSEDLALYLTFPAMPQAPVVPQIRVGDISVLRIDQFLDPDRTIVTRLSTILSGTLFFESLNGEERRLRGGEDLEFEHSHGELRTLELAAHQIVWKFHGRVRGMTTGIGEGRRSLMPTCLDWLRARHGLSLLWATSVYIFALIAGALRWWGVRI
jgi:hypothetical protein